MKYTVELSEGELRALKQLADRLRWQLVPPDWMRSQDDLDTQRLFDAVEAIVERASRQRPKL